MDDVIYNKAEIIERCIKRVKEEYQGNPENLENHTKQDSIILNIQRACEAAIDMAMHIVAERGLGLPQNSREGFELLTVNNIIEGKLTDRLKTMVGFRNIAVHNYQDLDLTIVRKIIEQGLEDLEDFKRQIIKEN